MNLQAYKLAFLGTGQMASFIIKALFREGYVLPKQVIATHYREEKILELQRTLPIQIINSNVEASQWADVVFLCVRPQQMKGLLEEIAPYLTDDKIVISIAAGIPVAKIKTSIPYSPDIFHVHPTSLAFLPEKIGSSFMIFAKDVKEKSIEVIKYIFTAIGNVEVVEERDLNNYIVMAGCVPAFLAQIISCLVDIGKDLGFQSDEVFSLEKRILVGIRTAILEGAYKPEQLISMIATPGGVTRAGLEALEKYNLKEVIRSAVLASHMKLEELSHVIE